MGDHRTVKTGFRHFAAMMPGRKYPPRTIKQQVQQLDMLYDFEVVRCREPEFANVSGM